MTESLWPERGGEVCRLFGLRAGAPVSATFWLIDAPDSLSDQSRRNPDGAGIGVFSSGGQPIVVKEPIAAFQDPEFAVAAHDLAGTTFVAHVRYASTGSLTVGNTHPFEQQRRLFAHNGVVQGLGLLDGRLAELGASELVGGDTDSERMFALITAETARCGGDVAGGIVAAISWIADRLPLYSLNFVLVAADELWALRYPGTHELHVLPRSAGGSGQPTGLDVRSSRIHARSDDLRHRPSVVVASEPMDDDPQWRELEPGELLYVARDMSMSSRRPFPANPRHQLTLADLSPAAATSQHPTAGSVAP